MALLGMGGALAFLALVGILLRERIWEGYVAWELGSIGLVVLEDLEPNREGDGPNADTLRVLARDGSLRWSRGGLAHPGDVSFWVGVALDRRRSRFYVVTGNVTQSRVIALDSLGRQLFRIDTGQVVACTVDEATGNLWSLLDEWQGIKETRVHGLNGNLLARHPWSGMAISYNRFDRSIWIVGDEILKLSAQGEERFRRRRTDQLWTEDVRWQSLAPDHRDGAIWAIGNSYLDTRDLKAGHLLRLDASGNVVRRLEFKGNALVHLACDARSGMAWVSRLGSAPSVMRIPAEGEPLSPLSLDAKHLAISERSGTVWVATRDKLISISPEGAILSKQPREATGEIYEMLAP